MVRIGQQDYFIHEPAMLRDGSCWMPIHWFQCGNAMYAKCWELDPITTDNGSCWRVIKRENYEVPLHQFLKTFPELREDAVLIYGLLDPTRITGLFSQITNVLPICLMSYVQNCMTWILALLHCGHSLTQLSAIGGVSLQKATKFLPFLYGCIVTTHRVIYQRNGTSITAFSSLPLVCLVKNHKRNIISIFSRH